MTDTEFFQLKNPQSRIEYCNAAAKLYQILLQQDAFENNVQIENYYNSFRFIFPNGEITIMILVPMVSPYYVAEITGDAFNTFFDDIFDMASWLHKNWDNLVKGT